MLLFSVIFLGIGCLFELLGIIFICMALFGADMPILLGILFCLIPIIFIAIGGVTLRMELKKRKQLKSIADNGRKINGIVSNIKTTSGIIVNDMHPLAISVRYFDTAGKICTASTVVEPMTEFYDQVNIGETLEISELNGRIIILRNLRNYSFPGSEMLKDTTVSTYNEGATFAASCPNCGAQTMVARGSATVCAYCGRKIRMAEDGRVE